MTVSTSLARLCGTNGCRLLYGHNGHGGKHDPYPTSVWDFLGKKDKNKLVKAGFATPRGGAKSAYQNHVVRSNQVIIPYEKLREVSLENYHDNYVVRLLPEQYFQAAGIVKDEFIRDDCPIQVGKNAFVLYRTLNALNRFPPPSQWEIRRLEKDRKIVTERGKGVLDVGHYLTRISKDTAQGAPQGLFAPEYADQETNYLCKCVLVWLIVNTLESPYTTTQAKHLQAILEQANLLNGDDFEFRGVMRRSLTCCPLCLRFIKYNQLHEMVSFEDALGNENASEQIEGATRSTIVNLFHILPLRYDTILHIPSNVAWGHAVCNTHLGQRPCLSLTQIKQMGRKVGIINPDGSLETFGWISNDARMIRSPLGAVWIQLNGDMTGEEDTPPEPEEVDILPLEEALVELEDEE